MESRENRLLPDRYGFEAGEGSGEKTVEIGQLVKEIGQNLRASAEVLPNMVQEIERALYCMAYGRGLRRVNPTMATFLMATAVTMFNVACDDDTGKAGGDTSAGDTSVYEVDAGSDSLDTFESDSGMLDSGTDLAKLDSLGGLDTGSDPELPDTDQTDFEDVVTEPEITKLIQEDLDWRRDEYLPTEPHIKVIRKPLTDCTADSKCPYEIFVKGPQQIRTEDQNYVILRDPVPNDLPGGTVSTRFVDIGKYEICSVGDDFEISSFSGGLAWGPNSKVQYRITSPDGLDNITRTFDTESDVHRIATNEGGLFTILRDGECFDVEASIELNEEVAPGFSALQHNLEDIVATAVSNPDDYVIVADEHGYANYFRHSSIIGNLNDFVSVQASGTQIPQDASLTNIKYPCEASVDASVTGPQVLQTLHFWVGKDSLIENFQLPKIEVASDKPGPYLFKVEAILRHGSSEATLVTEYVNLDFSEDGSQLISLPYSLDLLPAQNMVFRVSLADIAQIDEENAPTIELFLAEDGLITTDDSDFEVYFSVDSEDPAYDFSDDYDGQPHRIQHTTFSSTEDSDNFVQIGADWTQPINDEREAFALSERHLRDGCFNYAGDHVPCPIASIELKVNEFLTLSDGEVTGKEGPYTLQRYKFGITSTHFSEPVSARIALESWDGEIWSETFEIGNGMRDYYLVTEIDSSLPASAVQILLPPGGIQGIDGCSSHRFHIYADHKTPVTSAVERLTEFVESGQIQVVHKEFDVAREVDPDNKLEIIYSGREEPGSYTHIVANLDDLPGVESATISFEEPYALVESCSPPYTVIQSGDDAELFCFEIIETNTESALSHTVYSINSDWTQPAEDIYEIVDHPNAATHYYTPTQETTLASWNAEERRVEFSDGQNYNWEVKIAPENSPLSNRKSQPVLQVQADAIRQLVYEGGEVPEAEDAFIVMGMEELGLCDFTFGCEQGETGIIPVYTTSMDPDTYEITLEVVSPDNPLPGPIVFVSQ